MFSSAKELPCSCRFSDDHAYIGYSSPPMALSSFPTQNPLIANSAEPLFAYTTLGTKDKVNLIRFLFPFGGLLKYWLTHSNFIGPPPERCIQVSVDGDHVNGKQAYSVDVPNAAGCHQRAAF
ncbi:hypothetical protein CSKR_101754 [Clonorchis sinensis]|uniref:Uncharacterized protein n=1 Tax=Clonorchis sinensis TaxID=79923 RepID=A0A3R7ENL2_CLOSI|nr:hypothetical protein CSKR_101754 [Clonorchis sinensis]